MVESSIVMPTRQAGKVTSKKILVGRKRIEERE